MCSRSTANMQFYIHNTSNQCKSSLIPRLSLLLHNNQAKSCMELLRESLRMRLVQELTNQVVCTASTLTLVCNKCQVGWLGITFSLDDGQPVIQVFKTGIISDVIHKHYYLQEMESPCNEHLKLTKDSLRGCHIYSCPAFFLLVTVLQYPTLAVSHLHHLQGTLHSYLMIPKFWELSLL